MLNYSVFRKSGTRSSETTRDLSHWLRAISDPKRLRLLDLIMRGVQCNCELGAELGIAPNLISHHLSVLREIGLVNAERDLVDSRWIYYSVNREKLSALNAAWRAFFDPDRIKPRSLACGPQATVCAPGTLSRKS
jgi:ArsR family transcriptional regulator